MVTQALLDDGDEVLIPAPDYLCGLPQPPWLAAPRCTTSATRRMTGTHPSRTSAPRSLKTKAIVVINPNNPTGAVYSREVLQNIVNVAREYNLLILADEIYDRILTTARSTSRSLPSLRIC